MIDQERERWSTRRLCHRDILRVLEDNAVREVRVGLDKGFDRHKSLVGAVERGAQVRHWSKTRLSGGAGSCMMIRVLLPI